MRKVFLVELLSMRRVQAARYAREAQVEKLIDNLMRNGPNPVALNEHIFATVDGIIGAFAFGDTYAADQFKEQFVDVINEVMALLSSFAAEDFFPNAAGRLIDRLTGLVSRRKRIFKKLDDFFELVIDQYLDPTIIKTDENRSHLVQELIDLWRQQGSTKYITKDHVKAILLGLRREDVSMEEAGALTFHKKTPLTVVPIRYHPASTSG
ncbi:hypothetical protein QOZ80_3BG0273680 [Eleusine coracana subsp. coracana]|nr:hypothetical protein QOZ80_3BG0273680 [Eleusine coracana subsp. coracana]